MINNRNRFANLSLSTAVDVVVVVDAAAAVPTTATPRVLEGGDGDLRGGQGSFNALQLLLKI
jgi:hypothetical protein